MGDPYPRSRQLEDYIDRVEEQGNISAEELKELRLELADTALVEGWLCLARDIYVEFDQRDKLRDLAEKAINRNMVHDALCALDYLGDKEGILKVFNRADSDFSRRHAIESYFGEEAIAKFGQGFDRWTPQFGYSDVARQSSLKSFAMASELAERYDLGVGIAKGGLHLTYLFNQFGLDTKVVDAHRRGRGATFKWVSKYNPQDIDDKKILVIDKDVISGRSSKKVLTELLKLNPQEVSLALNHDPVRGPFGLGSITTNVDDRYTEIYTPEDFTATESTIRKFDEMLTIEAIK